MYYVVCHTCSEAETSPDREGAQGVFTRHVDEQHEVVLKRIETAREASGLTRDWPSPASEPRDGEPESAGGGPVD